MSKTKKSAAAEPRASAKSARSTPRSASESSDPAVRSPKKSGKKSGEEDAESVSLSFEGALEQLENTVGRLEEGEMPLEEALELFETGVKLSRQCTTTLEAAERRIEILVADRADGNGLASEPFETDEIEDAEDFDED
jgi:exodeoxyribonuclease VII small subunit